MSEKQRRVGVRRGFRGASVLVAVALVVMVAGVSSPAVPAPAAAARLRAARSPATTAIRWSNAQWASVSFNPYGTGYLSDPFQTVQLPLAYIAPAPAKFGQYEAELASSWRVSGSTVTIHLRRGARWQNGKPFTSRDVVTSLLLAGADLNPLWGYVSSVTTPNPKTVVIHDEPGAAGSLVLYDVMQVFMLPNSQYGHLVPAGLAKDLVQYWKTYQPAHPTTTSVAAASSSSAGKTLGSVSAALAKFAPKTMLGDGPFRLNRVTSSEVLLQKWPGFWDARKIAEPWAEVTAMDTSTAVPSFLDGRVDFTDSVPFTDPIYEQVHQRPSLRSWQIHTNVQQIGLFFNFKHYPFNLLAVRKALAYLIDRKQLAQLDVGGTFIQRPPTASPDGISRPIAKQYLTKSQLAALNPYKPSASKAAHLLTQAGFTKKNGAWYLPNGKRWQLPVDVEAGNDEFEADGVAIARDLTNFGIDAKSEAIDPTVFSSDLSNGQFGLAEWFVDFGTTDPLTYFAYTLITNNYPATWSGKGSCNCPGPAIGIGPIAKVPGLGRVNLAQTLNHEVDTVGPGPKWRQLTWDWDRFVNQQLPVLALQNNTIHASYSTVRYTDWPPVKSKLWSFYGSREILIFNQHGYLKLKR